MLEPPTADGLAAVFGLGSPLCLSVGGDLWQVVSFVHRIVFLFPQVSAEAVAGGPASYQCGDHISQ